MRKYLFNRLAATSLFIVSAVCVTRADRLYMEGGTPTPGETDTFAFCMDNSEEYFGFQCDISLPAGLPAVNSDGKPEITFSPRLDSSYSLYYNVLDDGTLRLGSFSTNHTPIGGDTGPLFYLKVKASEDFSGGELNVKEIHLSNAWDVDVEFEDYSLNLTAEPDNRCYIPDFGISIGETKSVSVVLDIVTPFTAFQTDIYFPQGLIPVEDSFSLGILASGDHRLSAKSFDDGRVRLVAFSTSNSPFEGNIGPIVNFDVTATEDIADNGVIEVTHTIFSDENSEDYTLATSYANVTREPSYVSEVTLFPSSLELIKGESATISATVLPVYADDKSLVWSSSDTSVATVSSSGEVRAVGPGEADIVATAADSSSVSGTCHLTVTPKALEQIILTAEGPLELMDGESVMITATLIPEDADNVFLTWNSSDEEMATVENGLVTAGTKTGVVTITAESGNVKGEIDITVVETPVEEVILTASKDAFKIGETVSLTARVIPENATDKTLVWSSSNPEILTVEEGTATGIAPGRAYVYAIAENGVTGSILLEVEPIPAESLILDKNNIDLNVGEIIELIAEVYPENATDKSLVWESENEEIATVTQEGVVTGVSAGETYVWVRTADGSDLEESCKVTVIDPTEGGLTRIGPDGLIISFEGNQLTVSGLTPGTRVDLFSIDGKLIQSRTSDGHDISFVISSQSVWLLNVNGKTMKIMK